ncbi:hypothetical protein M422DRAFT_239300 [Sphaerobolus stellatus SS14]|nr:hypothetical protein M422DRAFT_239300 [Sphaerobolus stellatus SS14]
MYSPNSQHARQKRLHDNGANIIDLIFKMEQCAAEKNVWVQTDAEYKHKEKEAMEAEGWTPQMDAKKTFLLKMKIHKELFASLPEDKQVRRKAEAKKAKSVKVTHNQVLSSLPKLFALVCDAVTSMTGWYVEVWSAGLGNEGTPKYFILNITKMVWFIDYSGLEASKVQDQAFIANIAKANKVEMKNLIRLPPWKPNSVPVDTSCHSKIELRKMMEHDDEGNYMEYTYVLAPAAQTVHCKTLKKPKWDAIATTEKLEEWLYEIAKYIIVGELGILEEVNHFKQADVKHKHSKNYQDGEEIDIDVEVSSEEDSDTGVAAAPMTKAGKAKKAHKVRDDPITLLCLTGAPQIMMFCRMRSVIRVTRRTAKRGIHNEQENQEEADGKGALKPQAKAKAQPHPTVIRGRDGNDNSSDSDSDGEQPKVAYVSHCKLCAAFDGDYQKWYHDFEYCRKALNWEPRMYKPMGKDIVMAIWFIKATEVEEAVQLGGVLDVGVPINTDDDVIVSLFEALMHTNIELPSH